MKTSSFYWATCLLLMLVSACDKQEVALLTVVNEDGTCERTGSYRHTMTKAERDSAGWTQPVPDCLAIDNTYETRTEVEADTVTTLFRRHFATADEMSVHTPLRVNGERLRSTAKLEKRFRWFYTEYTFTETFACLKDRFKVAPSTIADDEVVSYWFTGQPNIMEGLSGAEIANRTRDIEPLVNRWLNKNVVGVVLEVITRHYDAVGQPPLNKEAFLGVRDSLATYLLQHEFDGLNVANDFSGLFQRFFQSKAYDPFFEEGGAYEKEMEAELEAYINLFVFRVAYRLKMPGKTMDTGIGRLRNDGVIDYSLTGERLIPKDYTLRATSRVTHTWAVVLSVLVVLIALGSLAWSRRKR